MDCLQCGAMLGKSDIFCIDCGAPVLTEDDVTTRLSTDNAKYIDIVTNSDGEPVSDTMPYIEPEPSPVSDAPGFDVPIIDSSDSDVPEDVVALYEQLNGDTLDGLSQNGTNLDSMTQIYESPKSKSKAIERLKGISLKSFYRRDNTPKDDELDEVLPEKGISRAAVIAITLVVCVALISVGLYILVRPQEVPQEEDRIEQEPIVTNLANYENRAVPVTAAPSPELPLRVDELIIFNGDHVQTAFHAKIDGTVLLRAQIVPDGADAVIEWVSSDPEILEIELLDSSGVEAYIIGMAAGIVDLTISVGDFVVIYPVTVDDFPMHLQLEDAIEHTMMPIWIDIVWTGGRLFGQTTLLEREPSTHLWFLESSSERSEVRPLFDNDGVAFSFSFADTPEVYHLFADGTGYIKLPDSLEVHDFMQFNWEFSTSQIEPEG